MRFLDLDKAIVFALLLRVWQSVAGVVGLMLIAAFFTAELQGFYYTFSSLLSLQIFVELGLYGVVQTLASREWSRLSLNDDGYVIGDPSASSRLASLLHFVVKWYLVVSLFFAIGVGIAGHSFLSTPDHTAVDWIAPWWSVVALATLQLWLMPIVTILEGCNQVAEINRFRFIQAVAEAITLWSLILGEAELWVAAGVLCTKILSTVIFLAYRYRHFCISVWNSRQQSRIDWRREIWPMQWRIGAQASVNYLHFSLFTPLMFYFYGPAVAGQMGMTLQIVIVIQMISIVWVQTKLPRFAILAAQKMYQELDKTWWRASTISFSLNIVGSLLMLLAIVLINHLQFSFSGRLLEPAPTSLFLLGFCLMQITGYQASYLRAHAKEPFLLLGVMGGLLNCALVFAFGSRFGPTGAAAGFAATIAFFMVPFGTYIWKRRRAEWQSDFALPKTELSAK